MSIANCIINTWANTNVKRNFDSIPNDYYSFTDEICLNESSPVESPDLSIPRDAAYSIRAK